MTLYVGEEFRITATGTDFDGVALTDANVNAATVNIYDADQALVLTSAMTWDVDEELWSYLWDTEGLEAGNYRYQVILTGADGKDSWEWKRARFRRSPITV